MKFGDQHIFLDGGFDVQLFSTLAEVTCQRYCKEQLSMVRPSEGGVPLFCQQLLELMIDIRRTSKQSERHYIKGQHMQEEEKQFSKRVADCNENSNHLSENLCTNLDQIGGETKSSLPKKPISRIA